MANIKLLGGLYLLKDNLHKVQTQIAEALSRRTETKLTGDKVTLVAVTKNHPVDVVAGIAGAWCRLISAKTGCRKRRKNALLCLTAASGI